MTVDGRGMLRSVQVGTPHVLEEPDRWVTAFFKASVEGPVRLCAENLEGDRQADLTVHGGPDKAVCVYSADHYDDWRRHLGAAPEGPAWFGENFTVAGHTEWTVSIGDVYRVGTALVEVAQPRGPCWKLGRRWQRPDMQKLVIQSGRSGWYLRVRDEGVVQAGDALTLVEPPSPQWTIALVNELTYQHNITAQTQMLRQELATCPALADNWRGELAQR